MDTIVTKKDTILDVAIRLFLEQGYYKSTMRQIAAEADVSLGLVVYHFGTKRMMALSYLQKQLVNLRSY
ncbi:MAG: helix-turn-helix domain-containing protein, partial [Clostridiales bacterium]